MWPFSYGGYFFPTFAYFVRVRRAWATGGFGVGNRELGRAENNGVSTSVTKGKATKARGRRGSGGWLRSGMSFRSLPSGVGGASCSCECGGLQCALGCSGSGAGVGGGHWDRRSCGLMAMGWGPEKHQVALSRGTS